MATVSSPHRVDIPATPTPTQTLQFRVLRDGQFTPTKKVIRVMRSLAIGQYERSPDMAFETTLVSEYTGEMVIAQQALLDEGTWAVIAMDDDGDPPLATATYMSLSAGGLFTLNISSGGGTEVTDPAQVNAMAKVDGQAAVREVVLIQRMPDGEWRVAGSGPTSKTDAVAIALKVTAGDVYAMGLDDFGVQFAPALAVTVGLRIRPTTFAGWLYEVTEAGMLPETEPPWWPAEGDNAPRQLGTARAVAVRYYRPLAHGPIPVERL